MLPQASILYHRVSAPCAGRRLVISDVHGCYRTLDALLRKIDLQPEDHLYLLGDYIHKGPDSRAVLEIIMDLHARNFSIFALRGNHEERLLNCARNSPEQLQTFAKDHQAANLLDAHGNLDPTLSFFMSNLPYYLELKDFYLVHAGFDFKSPCPYRDTQSMLTIRDYPVDLTQTRHRLIIHGHHPTPLAQIRKALRRAPGRVSLDNGCVYAGERQGQGHLLCLDLDRWKLLGVKNQE